MPIYSDIDLSLGIHPATKDVLKNYDVQAAKFALRNVMLTAPGENLNDPHFGCGIKALQFEIVTPIQKSFTVKKIREQVGTYLPEIALQEVQVDVNMDIGDINISVKFYVTGNPQVQTFSLVLERLR